MHSLIQTALLLYSSRCGLHPKSGLRNIGEVDSRLLLLDSHHLD